MFFNVEIRFQDNIIHKATYKSLSEMADKLGMKYQTCADIHSGRIIPKYISKDFPFQPEIKIEKTKFKEKSIDII